MPTEKALTFRVHTPDGTVYDGEVESLILPGEEGQFGVLYNHIDYMALLDVGRIVIREDESTRLLACGGGFAEIQDNEIVVLAETAEYPGSLDRETIESRIEEITGRLSSESFDEEDVTRSELQSELERNRARLEVLDETAEQ